LVLGFSLAKCAVILPLAKSEYKVPILGNFFIYL